MTRTDREQPRRSNIFAQAILILLLSFAIHGLLSLYFPTERSKVDQESSIQVDYKSDRLTIRRTKRADEKAKQKSEFIAEFRLKGFGEDSSVEVQSQSELSVAWSDGARMTVSPLTAPADQSTENIRLSCSRIMLTAASWSASTKVGLCLELSSVGQVYGGGAVFDQRWPINAQSTPWQAYVGNDFAELTGAGRSGLWGGFVERLWLTSRGLLMHVDDATPLAVGQLANRELCFAAWPRDRVYADSGIQPVGHLNMTLCLAPGAQEAYLAAHTWLYSRPKSSPDKRMLAQPVWCTWARHKTKVSQSDVEALAHDLAQRGYPASQIEIDDRYTVNYGDLVWDSAKFPNPKGMTDKLRSSGHRVTTWIVPFFNNNTAAFDEAAAAGYLVAQSDGNQNDSNRTTGAADILWWQGVGGLLDPTNPNAVDWFVNRLENFRRKFGIESFKFDAGEVYYLRGARTRARLESPMHFTRAYVELVAARFGGAVEVRAGYRTQSVPVATRMFDKDSHWGERNGLRSIVPNALMLSMAGYHFVMPDMIGGNAYSADSMEGARPDRELYIRWMQLSCFLPIVQFSIAPWDYDDEVSKLALETLSLRARVYQPALESALQELFSSGAPLTRPMWWSADAAEAEDDRLWTVDDQFFVGDSLLVAPVVRQGAVARDILLPRGQWRDGYSGAVVERPRVLKDYPAPISRVPHFLRI